MVVLDEKYIRDVSKCFQIFHNMIKTQFSATSRCFVLIMVVNMLTYEVIFKNMEFFTRLLVLTHLDRMVWLKGGIDNLFLKLLVLVLLVLTCHHGSRKKRSPLQYAFLIVFLPVSRSLRRPWLNWKLMFLFPLISLFYLVFLGPLLLCTCKNTNARNWILVL